MRITGNVIRGRDIGKKLGFPTANIELKEKLASGVYAGNVYFQDKKYKAGLFIHKNILEAHILEFSGDLYGKKIEVEIGKKIREAERFKSEEELKKRIKKDLEMIKYNSPPY